MEPTAAHEIEAAVREALRLSGVAGSVVVIGNQVELRSGAGATRTSSPVMIEVEHLSEQWPILPPEMRQRKAGEIARRLVDANSRMSRSLAPSEHASEGARGSRRILAAAIFGVLALAGLYGGVRYLRQPPPERPSPVVPQETAAEATARRARVCEAARRRVHAGSSIGPFDTEGWIVELWLTSSKPGADLANDPAISSLVTGGKLAASADDTLAALPDSPVEIVAGPHPPETPSSPGWSSVTIRFAGQHAGAFLDPSRRPRFFALADRLAPSAEAGALYARCAHLRGRDLGAWFYGADAPLAAVALVASMGLFADFPAVRSGAAPPGGELDALRRAVSTINAASLTELVSAQGASVSKHAGEPHRFTMTFPLGGPTRATTASRGVARANGVGTSAD